MLEERKRHLDESLADQDPGRLMAMWLDYINEFHKVMNLGVIIL